MTRKRSVGIIKKLSLAALIAVITSVGLSATIGDKQVHAASDTCTWTGGGADSNLTTAGNWTGCDNGNVPESGDSVEFPAGPTNKTVTLTSSVVFNNVTFSGNGYTVETTNAGTNQLYISSDLTISGNSTTINAYVRFLTSSSSTITHSATGTSFAHYIVFQPSVANVDLNFDIETDMEVPMFSQTAINGSSSVDTVTKTGIGTLELTGNAISGLTAPGGLYLKEGQWKCDTIYCLGDNSNEIIFDDDGNNAASSLYLGGGGSVANPITFNAVSGQSGTIIVASDTTLSGDITISGNANVALSSNHTASISSNIAIASNKTLSVYGDANYDDNNATFNGIISGNGSLAFNKVHASLSGNNTYTGSTTVENSGGGTLLTVADNHSLGGFTSGTTVADGATLELNSASSAFYDEPLTIQGDGVGGSYPGALVNTDKYAGLRGELTLAGDATIRNNSSAEYIGFLSQISGNYDLTLSSEHNGIGFVFQSSGVTNSYKDLIVNGTYLDIFPDNGDLVIPHNLTLNAVNGFTSLVVMERDNTIADDAVITLNDDTSQEAVLLNKGVEDAIGTIAGDGTVTINDSDAHFLLGGGGTSGSFSGTINGYANSQIEILGGTWTFTGTNADGGNGFESYYIDGGTMLANNTNTTLESSPFSMSAGVIGGNSTIGPISIYSGTVSPGNSPGCLSVNGDLAYSDQTGIYKAQLQNSTACSGYDRLTASGTIYLNDATFTLELLSGFSATHGQVFTIMQGDSVTGTFKGLSDGDTVQVDGKPFAINYTTNTVTLTYTGDTMASTSLDLAKTGMNILNLATVASGLIAASIFAFRRQQRFKTQP